MGVQLGPLLIWILSPQKPVHPILENLLVLALDAAADRHYAAIRTHLERVGQPIGSNDLLIAAHARALGLTLVSGNTGEFGRVPDLPLESSLQSA